MLRQVAVKGQPAIVDGNFHKRVIVDDRYAPPRPRPSQSPAYRTRH